MRRLLLTLSVARSPSATPQWTCRDRKDESAFIDTWIKQKVESGEFSGSELEKAREEKKRDNQVYNRLCKLYSIAVQAV